MENQFEDNDFDSPHPLTNYYYDYYEESSKSDSSETDDKNIDIKLKCNQWTLLMKLIMMIKFNKGADKIVIRKYIENIIKIDPIGVNSKNSHKLSAIHLACMWLSDDTDLLKLLINAGANLNSKCIYNETPLMELLNSDAPVESYKLLLEAGADSNICDNTGSTVLHRITIAATYKPEYYIGIIDTLIKYGADVNKINFAGCTPLMYGRIQNPILEYLITKGADINLQDINGCTIFHKHCFSYANNNDALLILGKHNPNVNLIDDKGNTPLHLACTNGSFLENEYLAKIKILLQLGFNIEAKNNEDLSPILVSIKNRNYKIAEYLLDCGASVYTTNSIIYNVHYMFTLRSINTLLAKFIDRCTDANFFYCDESVLIRLCRQNKLNTLGKCIAIKLIQKSDLTATYKDKTSYQYYTEGADVDVEIASALEYTRAVKSARSI